MLLCASIIALSVSVSAAPVQTRPASRPQDARILHFPAARALGELMVQDEGAFQDPDRATYWFNDSAAYWYVDGVGWERLGEARGDEVVPAGKRVFLHADPAARKSLAWLARLRPDDLYGLAFDYTFLQAAALGDADLRYLAGLSGLQVLNLTGSTINGIGLKHLQKMKSLRRIYLPESMTDTGLEHLAGLPLLEAVFFKGSGITDAGLARFVVQCPGVKELALEGHHHVTNAGLAELGKLKELEGLWLHGLFDDESLSCLKKVHSLRILSVTNALHLSGGGLRHLAGMNRLELLDLTGTQIVDENLVHLKALPALKYLNLSRGIGGPPSKITERGIAELAHIKTLERLQLPDKMTDASLGSLAALANLRELFLVGASKTAVTDQGVACLARMPKLESLFLSDSAITDAGLGQLAKLKRLRKLCIEGGKLSVSGLKQLNTLSQLAELRVRVGQDGAVLDLSGLAALEKLDIASLTNGDLVSLSGLSHLRDLHLRGDFTDKGLSRLASLPGLENLSIAGQKFSDSQLASLAQLGKLLSLSIHGNCTDQGLLALADCRVLKVLRIESRKPLSEEAIARFRRMRPQINLVYSNQ